MNRLLRWRLCSVLLALLIGCGQNWSESDKENADHFIQSIRLAIQAHETSNIRGAGVVSRAELDEVLSIYEKALSEASLVTDDVLAKANQDLPKNYRLYFQKGLELRISSWKNGKLYEEIQGAALLDSWGDWYEKNQRSIKIPRRQ